VESTVGCYGAQFSLSEKWVQVACLNPRKASAMDGVLLRCVTPRLGSGSRCVTPRLGSGSGLVLYSKLGLGWFLGM